ncbi:MAG: radical SAM/SPASM domain-containing protein [Candidatus Saganbacteria bacterium]|nr:radical SAM/SPASM domain-containing protein [Candidatus Saganbacteria bacterium]
MPERKLFTRQIEFEPTNHCNAQCVFCPRGDPRKKGYIGFETVKQGVALAKSAGIKAFKLAGFGEPLLHKELIEHLRYIRTEIPDSTILLITNGSQLTPELFEQLAQIPVSRINISFNGYDQQSYEMLMCGLSFHKLVAHLKEIAAHNRGRVNIQFVPILTRSFGLAEVEKMKGLLTGLGFDEKNFKFHHVITGRSGKLQNEKLLDEAYAKSLKDIEIKDKSKVVCLAALGNLFIGWNGDIHICCNDIYGEAVVGNIKGLKTAEELKQLEDKNLALRAGYAFDVCRQCDTPLLARHVKVGDQLFTELS